MPSNDHWGDETFDVYDGNGPGDEGSRPVKSKGGMSAMKIFVILLSVAGVLLLFCCGGIAWWARGVVKSTTTQPAEVEARTREFIELEIPNTLQPKMAMQIILFGTQTDVVVYQSDDEQGMLMLMNLLLDIDGADQQFDQQFDQQIRQQQRGQQMQIKESETREFEVRGKKTSFLFAKGTMQPNAREFRQVSGTFRGRKGTTFLYLQLSEEDYDEEAIVHMIESIK